MAFLKIYYQKNDRLENEIMSINFKSSDFDKILTINISHIISMYYDILERELEINVTGGTYNFVKVSDKLYNTINSCIMD